MTKNSTSFIESARVTAYSSLINFFGFFQGGVGFRGLYLKRHYQVSLKRYTLLTFIQYLVFFGVAGLMLIIGLALVLSLSTLFLVVLGILVSLIFLSFGIYKIKPSILNRLFQRVTSIIPLVHVKSILFISLISMLMLTGSMIANSIELSVIGAHVTLGGLLIYTGISQFAIIVALTPGAVGIREGILLLVQGQMMLSTNDIVLAATIDRLLYFITLGLFTPLALGMKRIIKNQVAD